MRAFVVAVVVLFGMSASVAGQEAARATSLADGRSGEITFESPTPKNIRELVRHEVTRTSEISGVLRIPEGAAAPVPAVVILHGSGGLGNGEFVWAERMNAMGYASFVLDSFTGRAIKNTVTDQTQLAMAANMADALTALQLLATHPRIDRRRIGVMGFSRGGVAALYTALEPIRRAVIADDLGFAAHIPFYPSCGVPYVSARLDGAPILMLLGGRTTTRRPHPVSPMPMTCAPRVRRSPWWFIPRRATASIV